MGTSQSSGGSPSGVPMVPPWVPDLLPDLPKDENDETKPGQEAVGDPAESLPQNPTPDPVVIAPPRRFAGSRLSFGRFVRTGSKDDMRRGLGRYVKTGYGGSRTAT